MAGAGTGFFDRTLEEDDAFLAEAEAGWEASLAEAEAGVNGNGAVAPFHCVCGQDFFFKPHKTRHEKTCTAFATFIHGLPVSSGSSSDDEYDAPRFTDAIEQYTTDGTFVRTFPNTSAVIAHMGPGADRSNLVATLNGKRKTFMGSVFWRAIDWTKAQDAYIISEKAKTHQQTGFTPQAMANIPMNQIQSRKKYLLSKPP
jgi:hypothetical protein